MKYTIPVLLILPAILLGSCASKGSVNDLRADVAIYTRETKDQLSKMEQNNKQLGKELEQLRSVNESNSQELENQFQQLTKQFKELNKAISNFSDTLNTTTQGIADLEQQYNSEIKDISVKKESVEKSLVSIGEYRNYCVKADDDLSEMKNNLTASISYLGSQLEIQKEKITATRGNLDSGNAQLTTRLKTVNEERNNQLTKSIESKTRLENASTAFHTDVSAGAEKLQKGIKLQQEQFGIAPGKQEDIGPKQEHEDEKSSQSDQDQNITEQVEQETIEEPEIEPVTFE